MKKRSVRCPGQILLIVTIKWEHQLWLWQWLHIRGKWWSTLSIRMKTTFVCAPKRRNETKKKTIGLSLDGNHRRQRTTIVDVVAGQTIHTLIRATILCWWMCGMQNVRWSNKPNWYKREIYARLLPGAWRVGFIVVTDNVKHKSPHNATQRYSTEKQYVTTSE